MIALKKYSRVMSTSWKSLLAYREDQWLKVVFSGARVLLAYLLWSALYQGKDQIAGYTFPMMMTYMLFTSLLTQLQTADDMAYQFNDEVLQGTFSKYLIRPVSVMGYFISAAIGRWAYMLFFHLISLAIWLAIFWHTIEHPPLSRFMWMAVFLPVGALCVQLFSHLIVQLSFKFREISGLLMIKNGIIEFLSGSYVPLHLLPAAMLPALRLTPFYYVLYYPINYLLREETQPPHVALLILLAWCLIFAAAAELSFRRTKRHYDGVGI
ncbi:MAG: ABC-2 family transporter protein [Anaerolineaceae bacterium]|nr:ABC-2 family transporter protein [Anaerolineaceae bacterium]